jgi:hypothetical protein
VPQACHSEPPTAHRPASPKPLVIRGREAIAAELGCGHTKVYEYATRQHDPLPIRRRGTGESPWRIRRERLTEWWRRELDRRGDGGGTPPERVEGINIIAAVLDMSRSAVFMAARFSERPLPLEGGLGGQWAYLSALQDWLDWREGPAFGRGSGTGSPTQCTPTKAARVEQD